MQATIFRCPNCGAELRFGPRGTGARPSGRPGCPYDALSYAALRAGHDALYFGAWRKMETSPFEIRRACQRLRRHLDVIAKTLGCSRNNVRVSLHRAIKALTGKMSEYLR